MKTPGNTIPWAWVLACVPFALSPPPSGAAPRTWTATGGQTVQAEFLEATADSVRLRRFDGREITVPLERLCRGDREWVAAQPARGATSTRVWGREGECWNPDDQTLIDFSFAGYHEGRNDFPTWAPGPNVRNFGAKADGATDDTEAFRKAVRACGDRQAVFIPNGTYRLTDWIGVREMVGTWVKPEPKSRFVLRGESRDGTVLLLAVGLQQIHPWAQKTGHGRPTTQWSWWGGYLWFQDSTEVGVENLTIRGGGGRYDIHWKEPGYNAICMRHIEDAWVRAVTFVDVDGGIFVGNGRHVTIQDALFESTPERPSASDFEDNRGMSGHHAILFSEGSAWCVADGIVFRNRFHHELSVNRETNHCVYSNVVGPDLHLDFHTAEDNVPDILFTQIDAGEGSRIWRNNFHGACSGAVLWNIRGKHVSLPGDGPQSSHPVRVEELKTLLAGWPIDLPDIQQKGRPWFEDIPPEKLHPQNIYHAQRRKRFATTPGR